MLMKTDQLFRHNWHWNAPRLTQLVIDTPFDNTWQLHATGLLRKINVSLGASCKWFAGSFSATLYHIYRHMPTYKTPTQYTDCTCLAVLYRIYIKHYSDIMMSAMVSQITVASIVYSTVCSGADQRTYQISESLAFVSEIHWWPVNPLHKGSVTQKKVPFDDVTTLDYVTGTEASMQLTDFIITTKQSTAQLSA